ncbi:hypothetical protein ACFE04_000071 [Oxalis oulophora]
MLTGATGILKLEPNRQATPLAPTEVRMTSFAHQISTHENRDAGQLASRLVASKLYSTVQNIWVIHILTLQMLFPYVASKRESPYKSVNTGTIYGYSYTSPQRSDLQKGMRDIAKTQKSQSGHQGLGAGAQMSRFFESRERELGAGASSPAWRQK